MVVTLIEELIWKNTQFRVEDAFGDILTNEGISSKQMLNLKPLQPIS